MQATAKEKLFGKKEKELKEEKDSAQLETGTKGAEYPPLSQNTRGGRQPITARRGS